MMGQGDRLELNHLLRRGDHFWLVLWRAANVYGGIIYSRITGQLREMDGHHVVVVNFELSDGHSHG